jgi:hypothetical protein
VSPSQQTARVLRHSADEELRPARPNHPAHERAVIGLTFALEALEDLERAADAGAVGTSVDVVSIRYALQVFASLLECDMIPRPLKERRLLAALRAAYVQTPAPTRQEERADLAAQLRPKPSPEA